MTDKTQDILAKAAECFMERGFHATSIDDVARRLGSTKGRVYHHYASKTDLFFDVHREGMARLLAAVERRGGAGRLRHAPGPDLQRIVDGWPKRFVSAAADRLGLPRDADVDALIDDHLGPAREHADG